MKAPSKATKVIDVPVADSSKKPDPAPKIVEKALNLKNKKPAKKAEEKLKTTEVPATVVIVNNPELSSPLKTIVETATTYNNLIALFVVGIISYAAGIATAYLNAWFF